MTLQALATFLLLKSIFFFLIKINRMMNQPQLGKNHESEDTLQSRQSNCGWKTNIESEKGDLEGLTPCSTISCDYK